MCISCDAVTRDAVDILVGDDQARRLKTRHCCPDRVREPVCRREHLGKARAAFAVCEPDEATALGTYSLDRGFAIVRNVVIPL